MKPTPRELTFGSHWTSEQSPLKCVGCFRDALERRKDQKGIVTK